MQNIINEIISTAIQIILLSAIPFLVYLIWKRKETNFAKYIGIFKPTGKSVRLSILAGILIVIAGLSLAFLDPNLKQLMLDPQTPSGKLHQMGLSMSSLLVLLIIAFFKTSFAEEVFFRGFLAKLLINKLGFKSGNVFQAVTFGLIHILLIYALISTTGFVMILVFIISTLAGWILGYIKVKHANGSIVPGWMAHGFGNAISYFIIAYLI